MKEGKCIKKEYGYNFRFIFEGEYLNGERKRKKKEYYNHILVFECEYLDEKMHGNIKDYDLEDKLEYEG